MDRMDELGRLVLERQGGAVTDEGILRLFRLLAEAPGTEVFEDPAAAFLEGDTQLDLPGPRVFLDAIRRREQGASEPSDAALMQRLIDFFRSIRGRTIVVASASSDRPFEIRS